MITYPVTITAMGTEYYMIQDHELFEHFRDLKLKQIQSSQHFQVVLFRFEHKQTHIKYYLKLKNCLGFSHDDLHFDALLKLEIRLGGTCYADGAVKEAGEAGYNPDDAARFIEMLIWDQTDPVVPKYSIIAEEITITCEEMP